MKRVGIYQIQSKHKPFKIYIGSAVNIHNRWSVHLHLLRKGKHFNKKLQNHYNKYGESDLQFSVLLGCDKEDLIKTEQYFIDFYNPWFNICQVAGNTLGYKHTEEMKKQFSLNNKGRPSWNKGKKATMETRLRQREAHLGLTSGNKGKTHSKETRMKISQNTKEAMKNPELRKKLSLMKIGSVPANKGQKGIIKLSEETKKKISVALKGVKKKPHTEEAKQKIRNAKLKYWINKKAAS